MKELVRTTITTLEVAEMMEVPHADILKKLEGRKDRKGYIQVISEGQMSVADYFVKSAYIDAQGKERPCYKVTKLGCDFLANKFTGEKGILFTARYVKRFYEMEEARIAYPLNPAIASSVADLGRVTERIMRNQGSEPHKVAEVFKIQCEQFGILLPEDFVKLPVYEQLQLNEMMG